jgi:peptidoglycan/LPS O-acetylase OafA/YrhL
MSARSDRIPGITALRAVAAVSVVLEHALDIGTGINGRPTEQVTTFPFGAAGVLIFFVISGYVIGLTRHIPTREFATRRIIRIYPPFWIACIIAIVAINSAGGDAHLGISDWRTLLLIPTTRINGSLSIPYWTMLFELAFYAAACAVFFLKLGGRMLSLVALVWIGAILLSLRHFTQDTTAIPGVFVLLSPYSTFFAVGLLVCLNEQWLLRANAGLLLIAAFLLASLAEAISPLPRLHWIAPSSAHLLLAAAIGLIVHLASRIRFVPEIVLTLGNSSYGLYLLHLPVNSVLTLAIRGTRLAELNYLPDVVLFVVPLAFGVAFGLIDFRVHGWLIARMRRFIGSGTARPVTSSPPVMP